MGLLLRNDFSGGWNPSADEVKGGRVQLLRMDNLLLDEEGVIALRPGSITLNPVDAQGVPVPLVSSVSSVHSLFTTTINGTRYRCAGVDGVAYKNFGSFGSFDGTGDIIFGSHQGMILAARGTTHWKNDGSSTRTWGIAKPIAAPRVAVLEPRIIEVGSFDTGESPGWVATEGSVGFATGRDGLASGAVQVIPASTTGKGTIEKTYSAARNYNSFDGGAASGAPEDSIEFYAWVGNPENLELLTLSVDVNPNSPGTFQDDYFYFEITPDQAVEVKIDDANLLKDRPDVEGVDRDQFIDDRGRTIPFRSRPRRDTPAGNAGWSKFIILRGQMNRVGSTPGTGWDTVKAIQLSFKYRTAEVQSFGQVKFDGLRILGGSDRTLTGTFKARYAWARDFGNYIALSPPSDESDEIECRNNGITVSVPAAASAAKDFQLEQDGGRVRAYIGGGTMKSFYQFTDYSALNHGRIDIPCTISERDAIIIGLKLETDVEVPPNNPVDIVGPHFNRIVVLTSTQIHVSLDGVPDSFRPAISLADPSESILWGVKTQGDIFIGTTKDIYRLSGTLSELPDGTTDTRLETLGINSPPISEFTASDGHIIMYLGADGLRLLQGTLSSSINWNLDLLVQGYTRHGVSPLNLGSAPGRFRGGIFNNRLYLLAPEGSSIGSSPVVYVANLLKREWQRRVYPRSFQVLYREPDGKILAGDSSGEVWQLDTQNAGDVAGSTVIGIPIELRTISDDDGKPISAKEGFDWRADVDTGGGIVTNALYLDEAAGPTLVIARSGYGIFLQTLGSAAAIRRYKRIQQRITGTVTTFRLGYYAVTYRDCPTPYVYWDSSLLDFGTQDLVWFRELQFKVLSPVNLRVRVLFDREVRVDKVMTLTANVESDFSLPIGKDCKGRLPLVIVEPETPGTGSSPNAFELYWMRVRYKGTGGVTEKLFKIKAPDA